MSSRTGARRVAHRRYTVLAALLAVGMLATTVTAGPATSAPASVSTVMASCPNEAVPSTQYAIVKKEALDGSAAVAVDSGDDSVYVGTINDPRGVWVFDGDEGRLDDSVPLAWPVQGIAVNQPDDTVYASLEGTQDDTSDDTVVVISGSTMSITDEIPVGDNPIGVAVNQMDDTVYVANTGKSENGSTLSVINGRTNAEDTISVGFGPWGVAILSDDTVYVASVKSEAISVVNGPSSVVTRTIGEVGDGPSNLAIDADDDSIYVSFRFKSRIAVVNSKTNLITTPSIVVSGDETPDVAVNEVDDTVYATSWRYPVENTPPIADVPGAGWVSIIDAHTGHLDDTMLIGYTARGVAVDQYGDNQGLVYVANGTDLVVVGRVSASVGPTSGRTGSTATITIDASQIDYPVDDTTVTAVCFGGTSATILPAADDDTWSVTVPRGSGSNVPVTVTLDGGLRVSAGTFTYIKPPPPPPPPLPPGAPTDVLATPGDGQASVSWRAPLDPGSSPISRYEVTPSPSGLPCAVTPPALACDITGLANGSPYTFTVRALNDAGWGAPSAPSNEVTPRAPSHPRIVISGSRDASDARRVHVSGATTDLAGVTVTPWFRFAGQTSHAEGTARPLVQDDGSFEWTRKAGRTIYVHFTHDAVRSNSVAIRR